MKKLVLVGIAAVISLVGCETVPDEGAETRPVGEPILSKEQLRRAAVKVSFTEHVRPILEDRCLHCHSRKAMPGKFSLESRAEAMKGGRIVPGNSRASFLITVLTTGNHAMTMPAVGTAPPPEEIEVLKRWINAGAAWPSGVSLSPRE